MRRILSFVSTLALLPLAAGAQSIVINEIMQNPNAVLDSDGEWLELVNTTGGAIDIDGWTIQDNDSDSHLIDNGGPLIVPANGYLVLGNNPDTGTNGGVSLDYTYLTELFLSNGDDEVVLLDDSLTEIDRVEYDGGPGFPDPTGASMALIDPSLDNNLGASWCEASTPYGDGDLGTPGAANDCPGGLALAINEIDYDQPGGDDAEFVEILNVGTIDADLSSYLLGLVASDGLIYDIVTLPAVTLVPGDYYVVCSDFATVANCDLDTLTSLRDGAPNAVALRQGIMTLDTVSYEGDTPGYTEGSGVGLEDDGTADFSGISRFPDGADSDQNNVDLVSSCITPGAANTDVTSGCTANGPAFEIFDIQGSGLSSPYEGSVVSLVDNVVTLVGPDGFFMQTPEARSDGDPETSDGVFVFTFDPPEVVVGDLVDVTGEVVEFFDLTEISEEVTVTVTSSGNPLPPVVVFDETVPSPNQPQPDTELERYEGMRVSFVGIATGPTDRFGDTPVVATTERSYREPGIEYPGLPNLPVWDGNPEVFEIDADRMGLPDLPIFAGQQLSVEGGLAFSFGDYIVWPSSVVLGPEPELPIVVSPGQANEFTIATLNMFRLFDDVDDPTLDDPVLTPEEFQDRLSNFSFQIRIYLGAPDIVAVQEVENLSSLEALADQINEDSPALSYTAHLMEGNDIGGIDVGFLTRDDTISVLSVDQFGEDLILSYDGSLLYDRPPLVLDALFDAPGPDLPLTVIAVHQRSLGGIDGSEAERVKTKRLEQAEELAGFVQGLQAADPEINLVVAGDFNAFQFSDGYVDVIGIVTGNLDPAGAEFPGSDLVDPDLVNPVIDLPAADQYSFVFDGSAQVLDHLLVSDALSSRLAGVEFMRGNADTPDSVGDDPTTPLGESDHDGLVGYFSAVGIDLSIQGDCPGLLRFEISGGPPNSTARMFWSTSPGVTVAQGGPCVGLEFDLEDPRLLATGQLDETGSLVLFRNAGINQCGRYLQVAEEQFCAKSQVVQIPN